MNYPYISTDNRIEIQKYMYSTFEGYSFLLNYLEIRRGIIEDLEIEVFYQINNLTNDEEYLLCNCINFVESTLKKQMSIKKILNFDALNNRKVNDSKNIYNMKDKKDCYDTVTILEQILYNIMNVEFSKLNLEIILWINRILKSFEVRKRIFRVYNKQFKPQDETDFMEIYPYVLLAFILGIFYFNTGNYKYLNSVLKINDTIISVKGKMRSIMEKFLSILSLTLEEKAVILLSAQKGINI